MLYPGLPFVRVDFLFFSTFDSSLCYYDAGLQISDQKQKKSLLRVNTHAANADGDRIKVR